MCTLAREPLVCRAQLPQLADQCAYCLAVQGRQPHFRRGAAGGGRKVPRADRPAARAVSGASCFARRSACLWAVGRVLSMPGQPGTHLLALLQRCASPLSHKCRTEPGSKAPRSETIQEAVDDILSGMEVGGCDRWVRRKLELGPASAPSRSLLAHSRCVDSPIHVFRIRPYSCRIRSVALPGPFLQLARPCPLLSLTHVTPNVPCSCRTRNATSSAPSLWTCEPFWG